MNINPLFDPKTDNQKISDENQKMLNTDLGITSYSPEDQEFLNLLISLVETGKIKVYDPNSLINQEVYQGLDEKTQGLTDQNAVNMLSKIRQIIDLHTAFPAPTYHMINLVASLRQNKERLEEYSGDIFII